MRNISDHKFGETAEVCKGKRINASWYEQHKNCACEPLSKDETLLIEEREDGIKVLECVQLGQLGTKEHVAQIRRMRSYGFQRPNEELESLCLYPDRKTGVTPGVQLGCFGHAFQNAQCCLHSLRSGLFV